MAGPLMLGRIVGSCLAASSRLTVVTMPTHSEIVQSLRPGSLRVICTVRFFFVLSSWLACGVIEHQLGDLCEAAGTVV